MNAIFGILIVVGIFAFVIPFITKIFGVSVKQKYSSNVTTPDTFDENVKQTKKVIDSGINIITQEKDKVAKQLKGSYKYLFDKIQKLNFSKKRPNITLTRFIEIRNNIEELEKKHKLLLEQMALPFTVRDVARQLNEIKIEHNENYIPYVKGIDLISYVKAVGKLKKVDNNEAAELVDKIGFEHILTLNSLLEEIENSHLRQDITQEQRKILRKIIRQKI